jgi:hypothetical protein
LPDLVANVRSKANGHVAVPLSRKQRRRLQRRLSSAATNTNNTSSSSSSNKLEPRLQLSPHGYVDIVDDDDEDEGLVEEDLKRGWTPVTRAGSVDRTPPPALETVTTLPNGKTFVSTSPFFAFPSSVVVTTSNAFDVLNSSLHDDPTPIKERSLNYRPAGADPSSRKLKFSPEVIDKVVSSVHFLAAPKQAGQRAGSGFKRSKSTSPTRSKNQAAKQRDIYKHFNPETADWIRH